MYPTLECIKFLLERLNTRLGETYNKTADIYQETIIGKYKLDIGVSVYIDTHLLSLLAEYDEIQKLIVQAEAVAIMVNVEAKHYTPVATLEAIAIASRLKTTIDKFYNGVYMCNILDGRICMNMDAFVERLVNT